MLDLRADDIDLGRPSIPESKLWCEVIFRALYDVIHYLEDKNNITKLRIAIEAKRWIMSEDTRPQTFLWCCESCSLDENYISGLVRERVSVELPRVIEVKRNLFVYDTDKTPREFF